MLKAANLAATRSGINVQTRTSLHVKNQGNTIVIIQRECINHEVRNQVCIHGEGAETIVVFLAV